MQNGYVREQGGTSPVASASEHNSDQLQAVGESLFVPNPDFLTEQKENGVNLTAQPGSAQPDSSVAADASKKGVETRLDSVQSNLPAERYGDSASESAFANTAPAPVGGEPALNTMHKLAPNAENNSIAFGPVSGMENNSVVPNQAPSVENSNIAPGLAPGAENNGVASNQILSMENGSATPKELEKLSNVAERKVAQARIESGDNPARFALLIARARREQIESAKGVKS